MIYHLMAMCHYLLLVEVFFFFIGLNWLGWLCGVGAVIYNNWGGGGMTYKISVSPLSSLQYHITVCFSEVGYKESAEIWVLDVLWNIYFNNFFFLFLYLYQYVLKQFLCHDQDIREYFSFFHSCFRLQLFIFMYTVNWVSYWLALSYFDMCTIH